MTRINHVACIASIVFNVNVVLKLFRFAGVCAAAALLAFALPAFPAEPAGDKDSLGLGHIDADSRDLAATPGAEASTTVHSSEERWQSSGAILRQGTTYSVSASGEWRQGLLCQGSGPSGTGSTCFPFPATLLKGVPVGALIGKIGKSGAPFALGEQRDFTAQADGVLYLRHNDAVSFASDNTGYVSVRVRVAGAEAAPAAAPSGAAPAAAKRPAPSQPAAGRDEKDGFGIGHVDVESRDLSATPGADASAMVMATEERWQSSGVLLRQGASYKVTASGQWRHGLLCSTGGPSGAGTGCFPFPVTLMQGIAVGTLIGKVGRSGAPFPIGEQREFTAQADGVLYLRHNDTPGMSFDNSGYVNVTVRLAGAVAASPAAAPQLAAPRPVEQAPAPPAAAAAAPSSVQHWAVIIGVSEYADSGIPSLRYATADARAVYDWLVSPGGGRYAPARVKLLLDRDATGVNIRDALFNWLRQAIEEDVVMIYFAGHGTPDSPDTPNNLYLVPHDARYQSIASTGFPMWDIETALKRFIKARRVIVVADACHAGGVGQGFDVARRAYGETRNPIASGLQGLTAVGPGVVVLSAADDKQFSAEGTMFGGGHGAFTHFLLEGLRGQADYNQDGRITLGELIPYLSENVRRATLNAQSPTVAGRFDPALSIGR